MDYDLQKVTRAYRMSIVDGFSRSNPWKEGKSWIMPGLKLKWDASGGKTMHEGALVLWDSCGL